MCVDNVSTEMNTRDRERKLDRKLVCLFFSKMFMNAYVNVVADHQFNDDEKKMFCT